MNDQYAIGSLAGLKGPRVLVQFAALFLLLSASSSGRSAGCSVPGSHTSIQTAVNDLNCDPISVGPGTFNEIISITRSLDLMGAGVDMTILNGSLTVSGSSTIVTTDGLMIDGGCAGAALQVQGGAQVDATGIVAHRSSQFICQNGEIIFSDGFE